MTVDVILEDADTEWRIMCGVPTELIEYARAELRERAADDRRLTPPFTTIAWPRPCQLP